MQYGDEREESDEDTENFQVQLKKKVLKKPKPIHAEHTSAATWVLDKRREMHETQQALDAQKQEFEEHEGEMKKRDDALKKKDRELQEALLKFNRFLLDNDTKRAKAERKYMEEKSIKEDKDQELQNLIKTLEQLKKEKEDKTKLLTNLVQYQRYLYSVLEHTEDYKEIRSLIERWNTLQATATHLRESIAKNLQESETIRATLQKYSQEKTTEILGMDNRIAELTKQLERLQHKIISATSEYDEKTETSVAKNLEFGQIKMACENIFRQISANQNMRYRNLPLTQQLTYIGIYLSDMQEIIKGYRGKLQPPNL